MPILVLKFKGKFNENPQKVRLTRNFLQLDRMTLVGYSIHLVKVDKEDLNAGKTHKIPHCLFVGIDAINCSELNVGLPKYKVGADNVPVYHAINKIPLPVSDDIATINFGCHMNFELCQAIHRDVNIEILQYDDNDNLIPAHTTADADGQVGVSELTLYFDYTHSHKKVSTRNYNLLY